MECTDSANWSYEKKTIEVFWVRAHVGRPKTKMSIKAITGKRAKFNEYLARSEDIGRGQTLLPGLVRSIKNLKTKKNVDYYRVTIINISKSPLFVRAQEEEEAAQEDPAQKKARVEPAEPAVEPTQPEEENMNTGPRGVQVQPGEKVVITCYDKKVMNMEPGVLIKIAVSASWYMDHYTFKSNKVLLDANADALTKYAYEKYIQGTSISEIPTLQNLSRDDFPFGTDPQYISRDFILPLSNDTSSFESVTAMVDISSPDRFHTLDKNTEQRYIGVNTLMSSGKTANLLPMLYEYPDGSKVIMKYAYNATLWECFGVQSLDKWKEVAPRLIFHAREWFVYGYSQIEKIEAIEGNADVEDENVVYSTGFLTKMKINMGATAQAAGIPLPLDMVIKHYESKKQADEEDESHTVHPLNKGWKLSLRNGKPMALNLDDFTVETRTSFFKEIKKMGDKANVTFCAVYPCTSDAPYELPAEGREAKLQEMGAQPTLVFAVRS